MSSASDYLETALLNHITNNGDYTPPDVLYAALFTSTAVPADLESGVQTNEVSGVNYERVPIYFDAAVQNQTQNSTGVLFNQAGTGGWGEVAHVGIMDSFTGGEILFHKELGTPRTVSAGDTFQFNITNVTLTIT